MKTDRWGRPLYPLTLEEQPIYDRLMKEYPENKMEIEQELLEPPEKRDWQEVEDFIVEF